MEINAVVNALVGYCAVCVANGVLVVLSADVVLVVVFLLWRAMLMISKNAEPVGPAVCSRHS